MSEIIDADVVVAGAGGTGLAAAHAAAEQQLQVVVLEKLDRIGGNTGISSGFFAIDTPEQRALGLHLSQEDAVRQVISYHHYLANGPLIHRIVFSSADTLRWLEDLGMEIKLQETADTTQFAHRGDPYKGGSYHMYQHKDESYARIQAALEQEGVQFRFGVTMQELTTDEAGEITGLRAVSDSGEEIIISAAATVVATGGFGADREKVAQVMRTSHLRSLGVPSGGEGLQAMVLAGAVDIDGTPLIHAAQLAESKVTQNTSSEHLAGFSHSPLTRMLLTPLLWVDVNGRRFANEDLVYDTVEWANAGQSVGGLYYFLVDAATLDAYTAGTSLEVSKAGPGASDAEGDFRALAEQAVAAGTAYRGTTIAELASAGGFDPDVLNATVAAYNEVVHAGHDSWYGKPAKSLVYSVETGPFYAFEVQVVHLGTVGGVRVDDDLRVLDQDMRPIPGLFTGGANAGGYTGQNYPPYEGMASGFGWCSGRIAGSSAARYVQSKRIAVSHN